MLIKTLRIKKGSASSRKADPYHLHEQSAAKRTARQQSNPGAPADQLSAHAAAVRDDLVKVLPLLGDEERRQICAPILTVLLLPGHATFISLQRAAHQAGVSEQTMSRWCKRYGLGRLRGGRWAVDAGKLAAYLAGGQP